MTSISDYDENNPICYFKISKIIDLKTKTGKTYWQYTANDGRKEYKLKIWNMNKKVFEGAYCCGVIELNKFGYTLLKCEVVK